MKTPPPELLTAGVGMLRPYFGELLTESVLVRGILRELRELRDGPATPAPAGELLTVREFCRRSSCSRTNLWKLRKAGHVHVVRLGGTAIRIPSSELVRIATTG